MKSICKNNSTMTGRRSSPKILYLSEMIPSQTSKFGGEIRCINVLRALQQIGTVEVVTLNAKLRDQFVLPENDGEFTVPYCLEVKHKPNRGFIEQLRWTFNPRTNYPFGYGVDHSSMSRVVSSMKEFDLVWFFKLRSADMFPNANWRCSVLDIDDLPSTYERAALDTRDGTLERLLSMRRVFAWQRREKLLGDRFSVLTVCSEEDKQYLKHIGIRAPIQILPNGFEKPSSEPVHSPATPPRIGFVGLFEYFPNRDGIGWFVDRCWPQIKLVLPDVRLRLVGQGSDQFARKLSPDIDGLGWLEDVSDEIKTWSAMLVPIRVGGGTRIKIAHGYSKKCPIVSTPFGAYGYGATNGKQMYIAETADEFSNACIRAVRDPEQASQMAERAWREFLERWTWEAIRPQVWAAVDECLRRI